MCTQVICKHSIILYYRYRNERSLLWSEQRHFGGVVLLLPALVFGTVRYLSRALQLINFIPCSTLNRVISELFSSSSVDIPSLWSVTQRISRVRRLRDLQVMSLISSTASWKTTRGLSVYRASLWNFIEDLKNENFFTSTLSDICIQLHPKAGTMET